MDTKLSFGRWVQQRRKALALTQHELAQQIGCTRSMIQKIERNARQPSRPMAELLAHHLELDSSEREAFLQLARRRPMPVLPTLTVAPAAHRPFNNLPHPLTSLVGREWEVTTLCARLLEADVRLLTITGPPGIGKTRLSLQVAIQLSNSFADSICFVALAPLAEARFVPAAIGRALGVEDTGSQPLVARIKAQVRHQSALLVLDNFEHVLPAAPLVIELLEAAPHLKILVTSRARLQVYGEHEFVVPPLALPDLNRLPVPAQLQHYAAVDLFVQRARAVQPAFMLSAANAPLVAEICVRLEGLPLALELAAARSKLFSLQTLLIHLRGAFASALDLAAGLRHLPTRHRSLRSAITWSYNLLNPTEQVVFRCLGVFAGGCTLAAAQAVIQQQFAGRQEPSAASTDDQSLIPGPWVLQTLQSLINHSLVIQQPESDGTPRFTLLEMMREYALEQLEQHGEADAARRTHATWFLRLAESHETVANDVKGNVVALVGRMEREIDNLRTALQWAATDDPDLELRLIAAMTQFWSVRRHLSEGRQWLERLVPRLQTAAPQFQPPQMAKYTQIHFMLAFFTWLQGDYALAQSRLEENVGLARQVQAWETMGSALQFLALTFYDRGDYSTAYELAQESVTLLREFGDRWHLANALTVLGNSILATGDQTAAYAHFEEALAIQRKLGNRWGVKLALLRLSGIHFAQGDDDRACSCLEDALQTFREEGQSWFVAQTLLYLGKVYWRNHAKAEATGSWDTSIALAREAGAKRYLAEALFMSGLAAQASGDQQRAKALFMESLGLYHRMENRIGVAYGLSGLAGLIEPPAQRARLLGVAATVLDLARLPMDQIERAHYEATVAAVRTQLGEAAFAAAWAEGQATPLAQGVAYALGPA